MRYVKFLTAALIGAVFLSGCALFSEAQTAGTLARCKTPLAQRHTERMLADQNAVATNAAKLHIYCPTDPDYQCAPNCQQ